MALPSLGLYIERGQQGGTLTKREENDDGVISDLNTFIQRQKRLRENSKMFSQRLESQGRRAVGGGQRRTSNLDIGCVTKSSAFL